MCIEMTMHNQNNYLSQGYSRSEFIISTSDIMCTHLIMTLDHTVASPLFVAGILVRPEYQANWGKARHFGMQGEDKALCFGM